MNTKLEKQWTKLLALFMIVSALACNLSPTTEPTPTLMATAEPAATATPTPEMPEPGADPTSTPTPTPAPPVEGPDEPEPPTSPCAGLSGEIEMRILVGPADAVGLEPEAVGSIPFAVTTDEEPYLVQGAGPISFADILTEEWGTYEVTMNLQNTISGECVAGADGGQLVLLLEMSGDQLVVVTADGFAQQYPWAGTHAFELNFPLVEGSSIDGEGYSFVLHLNSQ